MRPCLFIFSKINRKFYKSQKIGQNLRIINKFIIRMATSDGSEDSDPLFTLDVVRDFIMSKGGKVSNHTLVTHFKTFLNDSHRKVANRQKFKSYVNTLAAVKLDVSGDKVLVLKKQFRDGGGTVGTQVQSPAKKENKAKADVKPVKKVANTPVESVVPKADPITVVSDSAEEHKDVPSPVEAVNTQEAAAVESSELSSKEKAKYDISASAEDLLTLGEESAPLSSGVSMSDVTSDSVSSVDEDHKLKSTEVELVSSVDEAKSGSEQPEEVTKSGNPLTTNTEIQETNHTISEKPKAEKRPSDTLNEPNGHSNSLKTPKIVETPHSNPDEGESNSINVKERAKCLNNIQTDSVDGAPRHIPHVQSKAKKEREIRKAADNNNGGDYDFSLNEAEREWIIKAAYSDYQAMAKLLVNNNHLAAKQDFITGYTALHWAAKNGNSDVVKLLCGTHNVPVNVRSQGGYTALHLAAMHGFENIMELLIKVYGANANIRDYGGKKAKQHLGSGASGKVLQLLAPTRQSANMSGVQVYSFTPPATRSKAMLYEESELMPPPKDLPVVRRKPPTSRDKEAHSDSEMQQESGSDMQFHGSDSTPNIGTIV